MARAQRTMIAPGVMLTTVSEYKFKTSCLSVTLVTRLTRKTAALTAVLPYVLRRGTALHPDMASLEAALDDLYGARIEPVIRKKGEAQCVGFYADFADEAFAGRQFGLLEKITALVGEVLLAPATSGGRLRRDYVDSERENLLADLRAAVNDKRTYANKRLIELMCAGEDYGVTKLGRREEAEKISVATLTKYYKELLARAPVEVFYCGSCDPARVERAVRAALSGLPRAGVEERPVTRVLYEPKKPQPRFYEEEMDVLQAKLTMGYRLGDAMREANHAAMMVTNAVFGGSVTSKLFLNVREKLSLCYYASSAIDRHKGILFVTAGIDSDRYEEARGEIEAQLAALQRGDVTPEELEGAKKAVVTALYSAADSLAGLESVYLDLNLFGLTLTPEELAALADGVTAEEVARTAAGIRLDTVYYLRAKDGEADAEET